MPEWLANLLPEGWAGWRLVTLAVGLSIGTAVVSFLVGGYILSRLPADYFVNPQAHRPIDRHPVLKVLAVLVRNALGYFLVVLGVLLSLPGVPGQGLLTVLMGVMLIDLPGKHRLQRWLVSRRMVLKLVNRLRARAGRPPLQVVAGSESGTESGSTGTEGPSTSDSWRRAGQAN
jgi:hypothetical protein